MNGETFAALLELRAHERRSLPGVRTLEDRDLLCQVGYAQARGMALSYKQVLLLGPGSPSTVQRQVRRLRRAGVLVLRRSPADRRVLRIRLSRKAARAFEGYSRLLERGQVPVKTAA